MINLKGMEGMAVAKHFFKLVTQGGNFKGAISEFVEWQPLNPLTRHSEHCVEGAIARLDPLASAQDDQRVGHCVDNRLGAFALVDGLIEACAESSYIRESQDGTDDLAIVFCIRKYSNNEPLTLVA